MTKQRQPLAYVEYFDRLEFPNLDDRHSYVDPGSREKGQPVVLTPAGDVIQGQVRVAEAVVRAWLLGNARPFIIATEEWIAEAEREDEADHDSRKQWLEELASNAAGRNELYERARLTVPQLLAMRLVYGDPPISTREAAVQLGVSQSSLMERLAKAKQHLKEFLGDS